MSYDLMVFDTKVAPRERTAFLTWYKQLVKWDEQRDYDCFDGTCDELQNWYRAIIKEFPPMNGPFASADNEDDENITDYTIATHAIYIGFRWSVAPRAQNRVVNLGLDHRVGFFDVSADNGVILYDTDDYYNLMGL